ncbi:uncharacterized protein KGF55_003246 [Candida pseudojiufengensis]|uniref:uncharacterized protein n=1 Tax=Candida pseudojiufengensis TaxID=497109 RepID=UPI002225A3D4|nr:uncharacterized protein KGF55_003246 [Candida pseudojiufengensis]KAI5962170.1 hypothetical protein KGF55_003246 [Candida pseudojiufengensis]
MSKKSTFLLLLLVIVGKVVSNNLDEKHKLILNSGTQQTYLKDEESPVPKPNNSKWQEIMEFSNSKKLKEDLPSEKYFLANVKHCNLPDEFTNEETCYDNTDKQEDILNNEIEKQNENEDEHKHDTEYDKTINFEVANIKDDDTTNNPTDNLPSEDTVSPIKNNNSPFEAQGTRIDKEKDTEGWELNAGVFVEKAISKNSKLEISSSDDDDDGKDSSSDEEFDWWGKKKGMRRNKFFKLNIDDRLNGYLNFSSNSGDVNYPFNDSLIVGNPNFINGDVIINQIDSENLIEKDFKNLKEISSEIEEAETSKNGCVGKYNQVLSIIYLFLVSYLTFLS